MTYRPRWSPRFVRGWGSLALLPFPLLILANDAEIVTEVAPNGAGYRKLAVVVDESRVGNIRKDFEQFFPTPDWRQWSAERGGTRFMYADRRHGGVEGLQDVSLTTSGGLFSLWTTYEYTDEIRVERVLGQEQKLAEAKAFKYVVVLPGTITDTQPAALIEGGRAEWKLKPAAEPQKLTAKSVAFRLWYVVIVAYLVIWALAWALPTALRQRRPRPKRI